MVGYITNRFCEQARYDPRFGPISSSSPWKEQYQRVERIDPEPTDFKAFRDVHPDIQHPGTPDFVTSGPFPIVSDGFRQVVLSLEPDKHQFMPITLHDEARRPLPKSYWLMNVLERLDCVIEPKQITQWSDEGHSLPEVEGFWVESSTRTGLSGKTYETARRPTQKVIYLDRLRIEGLHLWRPAWRITAFNDVRLDLFFSDELLERVRRAKLRKLTVKPVVEISVPRAE
jgi:hypothetical protein